MTSIVERGGGVADVRGGIGRRDFVKFSAVAVVAAALAGGAYELVAGAEGQEANKERINYRVGDLLVNESWQNNCTEGEIVVGNRVGRKRVEIVVIGDSLSYIAGGMFEGQASLPSARLSANRDMGRNGLPREMAIHLANEPGISRVDMKVFAYPGAYMGHEEDEVENARKYYGAISRIKGCSNLVVVTGTNETKYVDPEETKALLVENLSPLVDSGLKRLWFAEPPVGYEKGGKGEYGYTEEGLKKTIEAIHGAASEISERSGSKVKVSCLSNSFRPEDMIDSGRDYCHLRPDKISECAEDLAGGMEPWLTDRSFLGKFFIGSS